MWIDIASIVFVCVTMNHLGLVSAIEKAIEQELLIINCPKCCTFWLVLIYTTFESREFFTSLAISFLASYIALWLELLEGYTDTLYMMFYEKIYSDAEDHPSATDD